MRVVTALGIAAAVIGFAGCGQDSGTEPAETREIRPVSLPLAERTVISVGVAATPGEVRVPALDRVAEAANVSFEYVPVDGATGMLRLLVLGEMSRAGEAPDIVDLRAVPGDVDSYRGLLLNLLDYPESTPNLLALARSDPSFLDGLLQSLSAPGELHGMPQYLPGGTPFLGTLALRADLFERRGLNATTWETLYVALRQLKASFPASWPFGITGDDLLYRAPSWFGSGHDQALVAYYHPEQQSFRLGPLDPEYQEYVRWFAAAHRDGLLNLKIARAGDRDFTPEIARGAVHVVFLSTRALGGSFGRGVALTPIPIPRHGSTEPLLQPRPWSPAQARWAVSRDSPLAAEALAVLDLLLADAAPATEGRAAADDPADWRRMAIELNRQAARTAPWPFLPEDLRFDVGSIAAGLARIAAGETMKFILGQRPLSEYDRFLDELEEAGASKLLEMLNAQAIAVDFASLWESIPEE